MIGLLRNLGDRLDVSSPLPGPVVTSGGSAAIGGFNSMSAAKRTASKRGSPASQADSSQARGAADDGSGKSRTKASPSSIQSVARALSVLELFDQDRQALSAVEVAGLTGLNRATAYRFCQALASLGYLTPAEDGRRFRPGLKTVSLAQAALSSYQLPDLAMPHLRKLEEETGEAVNMAALDGAEVVYLARVLGKRLITLRLTVGSRLPAHATSLGRAILAFLPEREARELLERTPREQITEWTKTDERTLLEELKRTRERGYALNDQELAVGLRGIAAPVLNAARRPVAAINLSIPHPVSDEEIATNLAPKVQATAAEIGKTAVQLGVEGLTT